MWYAYKIELFLAIKKTCSFAKEKRKEKPGNTHIKEIKPVILRPFAVPRFYMGP